VERRADNFTDSLVSYRYAGNTTIVKVSNRIALQLAPAIPTVLRALLATRLFDSAIVMMPHPDCFLQYGHRVPNSSAACWIDLRAADQREPDSSNHTKLGGFGALGAKKAFGKVLDAVQRRKTASIRSEFNAAFGRTGWVEVSPWYAPMSLTGDAPFQTLSTDRLVMNHKCSHIGKCQPTSHGHQCTPGTPTLLVARLLKLLRSTLNEHRSAAPAGHGRPK